MECSLALQGLPDIHTMHFTQSSNPGYVVASFHPPDVEFEHDAVQQTLLLLFPVVLQPFDKVNCNFVD